MKHTAQEFARKMNDIDLIAFAKVLFKHSYGGAITNHSSCDDILIHKQITNNLYLFDIVPYQMNNDPFKIKINTPNLLSNLENIYNEFGNKSFFWGEHNQAYELEKMYIVNNFQGFTESYYKDFLLPQYQKLADTFWTNGRMSTGLGTIDIFLDTSYDLVIELLRKYYKENYSLCIEFFDGKFIISDSSFDTLFSGVGQASLQPYNSIIRQKSDDLILNEFEELLNQNPSEAKLEKFLTEHFQTIFGEKYDRIETQISLNFPDLDIAGSKRRIDLFLHDAQKKDWELMELKKLIPLGKMSSRSTPIFRTEVITAIMQLKNYQKILEQSMVKQKLYDDGIKYYQPSFTLIAGRGKPSSFTHEQWRWLVNSSENANNLKFLTYDDLLAGMKLRIKAHSNFLGN